MRKDILEKRLSRLSAKKTALAEKAMASENIEEVRSINSQLAELGEEIAETQAEIEAIDEETRSFPPTGAKMVNGGIVGSYGQPASGEKREDTDIFASMEYRQAFKAYAQTGTPIPAQYAKRDGTPATTTSLGATIPTTVLNEFINV